MIRLHVEPRKVTGWEQFKKEKPAFSIALDGYVRSPPAFDSAGPYANFDHHVGVDRLATRSSAAQVYVAVLQGLFKTFQKDGKPFANIYVNDPDQDVSLAVWLLRNSNLVLQVYNKPVAKRLARFVQLGDLFDTTGGMCHVDLHDSFLQKFAWVFEPYAKARHEGKILEMDAKGMEDIIDAVGRRVSEYAQGDAGRTEINAAYEVIGGGEGWSMVKELGPFARCNMLLQNINAFVSARESHDGRHVYSIGKASEYIQFPVLELYEHLNRVEGLTGNNSWGSSDTIGGSPREGGSRLSPKELEKTINDFLAQRKK